MSVRLLDFQVRYFAAQGPLATGLSCLGDVATSSLSLQMRTALRLGEQVTDLGAGAATTTGSVGDTAGGLITDGGPIPVSATLAEAADPGI